MNNRSFPTTRMRRLRKQGWIRDLVRECHLTSSDLVWPTFVVEGKQVKESCGNFPGVYRYSIDKLIEKLKSVHELGIKAVALFPVVDESLKDKFGSESKQPNQLMVRAIQAIKQAFGDDLGIIADVALDPYTLHGHDGVLDEKGYVDNDATVDCLIEQSLILAASGCDVLAPSDMQDGRIGAIRSSLESSGFTQTLLLSYAVKYASKLYAPFRGAVGSSSMLGCKDKAHYQQDFGNGREALVEVLLDLQEGADMIMIKPAMMYQDIIHKVKEAYEVPLWAYQVSGEYSMIKNFEMSCGYHSHELIMESLVALKRSGSDVIITYAACEVASLLSR